jgi:hypothetical protein
MQLGLLEGAAMVWGAVGFRSTFGPVGTTHHFTDPAGLCGGA